MAKYKNYIEGLRWARIGSFLRKLALDCNLDIDITIETGFLHNTYFYTLTGEQDNIQRFLEYLKSSIEKYNNQ